MQCRPIGICFCEKSKIIYIITGTGNGGIEMISFDGNFVFFSDFFNDRREGSMICEGIGVYGDYPITAFRGSANEADILLCNIVLNLKCSIHVLASLS